MESEKTIDFILRLYREHGAKDYHGEAVTQLDHMYQMALLAEEAGQDEEVILAAFLHDIGHLLDDAGVLPGMNGFGVVDHEKIGAAFLRDHGFSERIASLVESHVDAKRYLVATDASYERELSEASRQTLQLQGGPIQGKELEDFESDSLFSLKVQFRRWDDAAKRRELVAGDWQRFAEMLRIYLESREQNNLSNA